MGEARAAHEATIAIPLSACCPYSTPSSASTPPVSTSRTRVAEEVRERVLDAARSTVPSVGLPEIVLSPEELLSLAVGDVISLHRAEGSPVRLSVDGVQCCEVVPTSQGRRLACLVVESSHRRKK